MPVHNRPQELKQIHFTRLKNLVNLTISFQGSPITGIFGTNGSGKSTILHALACIYKPSPNAPNADPQQLRQDRRVTHYLQDF